MKRSWIGAAFLAALLVCGILVTRAMTKIHRPIEADLERAAVSALRGDWRTADRCFRRAEASWEKWEHFRACFADHTPVEEAGAAFRALDVYRLARSQTDFAAHCRELAKKTAAVGEAHGLAWWNIF